jgi:hypothetical protein
VYHLVDKRHINTYTINNASNIYFKVGLSEPHRIGQAKRVKIKLRGSAPMQIDGEPWEQHPAEISIDYHKTIPVLKLNE